MKQAKIAMLLVCAAALAALLPACSSTGTTAAGSTGTTSQVVPMLAEAGFTTYAAKTAAQKAHVQNLPADKLTKVNRQGTYMWVYPDAANGQVYVGNSQQYKTFRALRQSKTGLDSEEDMVTSFDTRGGTPVSIYDGFVPMNALD
jgi:hypothetical protein